ncbi:hypothetical protein [Streptomyces sp. NPDC002104]
MEREGVHRPVPRAHSEEITVEGEAEPVVVKLGVWVSNTKNRRDRITVDQLAALAELGTDLGALLQLMAGRRSDEKGTSGPAENGPSAPLAGPSCRSAPSSGPPGIRLQQSRGRGRLRPHYIGSDLRIYPQISRMGMHRRRLGSSFGCFGDIRSHTCSGRPREGVS